MAATDDRVSLLELGAPAAPTALAKGAPAPSLRAVADTALQQGRALLVGAKTPAALDHAVEVLVERYPDANHPIRATLRDVYRAVRWWMLWLMMWDRVGREAFARSLPSDWVAPVAAPAPVAQPIAAPVTVPAVVPVAQEPHRGGYKRYGGEWRGYIPHTGRAIRTGDRVLLGRKDGSRLTTVYVARLISTSYFGGTLFEYSEGAPIAASQPVPANEIQHHGPAASIHAPQPAQEQEQPSTGSLVGALGVIASEGATNAAGATIGSMAGGQLRGVGFTSAEGYVTALANGVKQATADEYKRVLATSYAYTTEQIAALTVTIIAESTLPVGEGIVHDHRVGGLTLHEQRAQQQREAAQQLRRTQDAAAVAFAQRFTATAEDPTAWWEIGWDGHGSITRGELIAAVGRAPEPKVAETQLGRTMDSLRHTHDCALVTPPGGVRRRWQIGRGRQHNAFVGAEYGRVLAIVDMMPDGTLRWEGDASIVAEVRAEYDRLTSEEIFRPGDVTSWLGQILRYQYGARRSAHNYLVPPERREEARELCTKLSSVWARGSWVYGRIDPTTGAAEVGKFVTDVASILGALLVAANDEITAAEQLWQATVDAASKKGEKVGARAAANALTRHDGERPADGLMARVDGLRVLGDDTLAPLRARVRALREAIVKAVDEAADGGSMRSAMLELK